MYGYCKVYEGLRKLEEACEHNHVCRLMQQAAIRS